MYICGDDIYICFRTRMRAVLATKRDTRAAIMTVSCTVFDLWCLRDSVRILRRWRKWISDTEYCAIDGACAKKILSNPLCGDKLKFPNLNAFAQHPQVVKIFKFSLFIAHHIYHTRRALSCSYNLRKFDTLAKKILVGLISDEKFVSVNLLINLSEVKRGIGEAVYEILVESWAIAI